MRNRNDESQMTAEEVFILNALRAVESIPAADTRLTNAACKLAEAKQHLGNYIDGIAEEEPKTNLTFGHATEAAKQGRRVARLGWNGKGLFVFMQIPAVIKEEIIPIMQSLPQAVKDEFAKRGGSISYQNQFGIVYPDNSIHGWTPSPSDTLAEDWVILD